MKFQDIEFWSFDRKTAAKIVGLSDTQLANWLNRHGLFSDRRRGTGRAHSFVFKDLMHIAGIRALIEVGVEVQKAIDAFEPYGSIAVYIYGQRDPVRTYPGTRSFIQNGEGRWIGADAPNAKICLEVRAWPIFDDLYPRFKQAVIDDPWQGKPADVDVALAEFERLINERRAEVWGE